MGYYDNEYRPGGFSLMPPAIKFLIISNVVIFLFGLISPQVEYAIREFGALFPVGNGFKVWQPVTYLFLHGGFWHLLFNMLALWMFGMEIENYWGTKHFTMYYLACGVGAGLLNLLTGEGPTVGASGAVYGVLLAFGMMFPDRLIYFYFFIPVKAKYLVVIYAVIEIISTFNVNSPVAHVAHLGGMLIGFIYIKAMRGDLPFQGSFQNLFTPKPKPTYTPRENRRDREAQVDSILDKISRSGYESLTSDEKRILLEASKEDK
jgi:membrane associated rhomboid family serine protease